MLQIKKILFPTDFSRCADQAFRQAIGLARRFDAELHIVHAVSLANELPAGMFDFYSPRLYGPGYHQFDEAVYSREIDAIYGKIKKNAIERMQETITDEEATDLSIVEAAIEGVSPAPAVLEYASLNQIDLIVLGTHGRRGIAHLFLGSVAEEIVRFSDVPVLTIRETDAPTGVSDFKRILVPFDFSSFSEKALAYAIELRAQTDATLQLLHVVEPLKMPDFYAAYGEGGLRSEPWLGEVKMAAVRTMLEHLDKAGVPRDRAEVIVTEGHAARSILEHAKDRSSDLIVIATHGLTGLQHLLMGSVTEKVVRQSPCPVFTLRGFGKDLLHGTNGQKESAPVAV